MHFILFRFHPLRTIIDELEVHDEAWPFLLPVNTKQFPTYRKIIRLPMDLSTIRRKLTDGMWVSFEFPFLKKNCLKIIWLPPNWFVFNFSWKASPRCYWSLPLLISDTKLERISAPTSVWYLIIASLLTKTILQSAKPATVWGLTSILDGQNWPRLITKTRQSPQRLRVQPIWLHACFPRYHTFEVLFKSVS